MIDYRERHRFPSKVYVDYDSHTDEEYFKERNAAETNEDLINIRERWRYLFPELSNDTTYDISTFKQSLEAQDAYVERAKGGDKEAQAYLNLLMPHTLLRIILKSREYTVSTGTVIMQMWNANMIKELPDGSWRINKHAD